MGPYPPASLHPRSCLWLVSLEHPLGGWQGWLMGEEGQALGTSPGSESNCEVGGSLVLI